MEREWGTQREKGDEGGYGKEKKLGEVKKDTETDPELWRRSGGMV